MTSVDDAGNLDRIEALAAAAGLPVEEYLQAALTAHARRKQQRPTGSSSLYQRIRYAGGLRRVVDKLYPRVLADPSLLFYFQQLQPSAQGASPAATAAAEPPDEPPGTRSGSQGLRVGP